MLRYLLSTALLVVLLISVASAESRDCTSFTDTLIKEVERIRGHKMKRVKCLKNSKAEVREYINSEVSALDKLTFNGKTLFEIEELVFKGLGILDEKIDYKNALIDFYVSQIGGYYDPKRKIYVMADWLPDAVQGPTAVHELTHALQDQQFDLKKFYDDKLPTDEKLARQALVEGDAMAVMTEYSMNMSGVDFKNLDNVNSVIMQGVLGSKLDEKSPEVFKLLALYPYMTGVRYAHHLVKGDKDYRDVDAAFKNPRMSTKDVIQFTNKDKENTFERKGLWEDKLGFFLTQVALGEVPEYEDDYLKMDDKELTWRVTFASESACTDKVSVAKEKVKEPLEIACKGKVLTIKTKI